MLDDNKIPPIFLLYGGTSEDGRGQGEKGDQVYDGLMWEYDTKYQAIKTAKSVVVTKRQEFATVQHIRETILSEEKIGGDDEASV